MSGRVPDAEEFAEKLIKAAGSKRKAKRLIDRARTKALPGRRKGTLQFLQYREVDVQLLVLVETLRLLWRVPSLRGRRAPKREALIAKIVKLCWDPKVGVYFGLGKEYRLGDSEGDAVQRLLGRKLKRLSIGIPASAARSVGIPPQEAVRRYHPPLQLFEIVHRARPDLQLPDDYRKTESTESNE